ncbi:hypothetical protein [Pseudoxanthomonas sp. GM95]|uniref:hypothetical protein n=1 Tax=Pseudoxanthomonas sp. GM95 TaxID=1881043 RepID=UPI000B806B5D|nr:hypothetical protein [Pseudoxanthomonas sp. GM95]
MSPTRSITFLLATCMALPACSHAPLSKPSKEEPAMTTATPTAAPRLDASLALQRVLDLIGDSQGLADLTPAHISQKLGVPMEGARNGSARYGFGESLNAQWTYGVSLDATAPGAAKFEFSFNPSQADAPMTGICQMDYDAFTAKLEALGFKRTPYSAEHGRFVSEWFDKPGLRVSVYPQGETAEAAAHRCVRMVTIP